MKRLLATFCICIIFATISYAKEFTENGNQIRGIKPSYLESLTKDFANVAAVEQAAFTPDLNEGFVPQGLVVQESLIFLSGYVEFEGMKRSLCRLYAIEKGNFSVMTTIALPKSCKHAGGLTLTQSGVFVVSDNIRLFVIPRMSTKEMFENTAREILLAAPLKGTFVTSQKNRIYLGSYLKDLDVTRVFVMPESVLEQAQISLSDVVETFDVPSKSQGVVFSQDGFLWTTSQAKNFSYINKMDARTKLVVERYRMVRGLEGIAIDYKGFLWSVSESGAWKYRFWPQRFPAIFQFDPDTLQTNE